MCFITIVAAMMAFPVYIAKQNCMCKFWMVPLPDRLKNQDAYDDLTKIIIVFPWIILNAPFWVPWLLFGCFLYVSKIFAINQVANLWYEVWSGSKLYNKTQLINGRLLNESIYTEIFYETFPQLVIQLFNNSLLDRWSPLAIFSMVFSIFNATNGVFRVWFYKCVKKIPLVDIPIHLEVFGTTLIKIDPKNQRNGEENATAMEESSTQNIMHNNVDGGSKTLELTERELQDNSKSKAQSTSKFFDQFKFKNASLQDMVVDLSARVEVLEVDYRKLRS